MVISNHGRETHVLLGIELWEQAQAAANSAGKPTAGTDSEVFDFASWIDDAVIICDQRLHIVFANRAAHAITRRPTKALEGRPLIEALPEIDGTLLDLHTRRTMVSGEPSALDIPSPFHDGSWLRLETFPLRQQNAIVFRDISEEVQRHRMADVKAAILDAMAMHGAIGYLRISPRATIERAEGGFADMLGLPAERLVGVPLIELSQKAERSTLRAAIDEALSRGVGDRMTVGILGNDAEVHRFTMAIVPLNGAYGGEGAICLFTPI